MTRLSCIRICPYASGSKKFDEFDERGDGIRSRQRYKGAGFVGLGGAAASQVGEPPDDDERHPLLVADEGHRSALHVNWRELELGEEKVPVRSIIYKDAAADPSGYARHFG